MTKRDQHFNLKNSLLLSVLILGLCLLAWRSGFCLTENREKSIVRAVRNVRPAVVNISSQYEIRKNSNPFSGYGMDPWLENFFRDFFSPELERREERTSLGSGVIIDGTRGLVLTNTHVVERASIISVALNDTREFEATIVGRDPDSDLAVLKISTDQVLPAVQMGDSDDIMIGESVIAIGNPFGFSHTVTSGVVSAVKRSIKTSERVFHEFIQTDAAINPGNSGGPLLNINGELIGINTAIYAQAQGIGFAIPINRAKRIISDLINYGTVVQPWIGVKVQRLDDQMADYLDIGIHAGVLVTAVEPGSPADQAGLREGDILTQINGKDISDLSDYQSLVSTVAAGQTISININRHGDPATISLETSFFPLDRALDIATRRLGIVVADLDQQTRIQYGIVAQSGVLITKIRRNSHLERIGLRPGDVIRQIDEERVDTLAAFKSAIVKCREKPAVVLLVQRDTKLYYINAIMKDYEGWNG